MDGDDVGFSYSLGQDLATEKWAVAATYKSEVKLNIDGSASLKASVDQSTIMSYRGAGNLEVSLPAVFGLATSWFQTSHFGNHLEPYFLVYFQGSGFSV